MSTISGEVVCDDPMFEVYIRLLGDTETSLELLCTSITAALNRLPEYAGFFRNAFLCNPSLPLLRLENPTFDEDVKKAVKASSRGGPNWLRDDDYGPAE